MSVIELETFAEIPEPQFPLNKACGRVTYDRWCRQLIKSGKLTMKALEHITSLAVADDMLAQAISSGKNSRPAMELRRSAMLKLEKFEEDAHVPVRQGTNPFSVFGFAKRAREARHAA